LEGAGLLRPGGSPSHLQAFTTADAAPLQAAFASLLDLHPEVQSVEISAI
jgi:glutamate racemase